MLNQEMIGHALPDQFVDVEAGQLRFFAKATGETDPIYSEIDAARAAGHRALPAPPTFLFSLEMMARGADGVLKLLNVDIGRVLHGEQEFSYTGQMYAGDRIKLQTTITDIYAKKGGVLEFVVQETVATNQYDEAVGKSRTVTVVRNG